MMYKSTYFLIVLTILSSLHTFSQNNKISSQGDINPLTIRVEKGKTLSDFMDLSQLKAQQTDIDPGQAPEGDYMLRSRFSPDGTKLFLVTGGTNNVTVYDFETMSPLAVISGLTGYPTDIDLTENYAVVPCLESKIHIIDLTDYSITETFDLGDEGQGVAVETSADGHFAYVTMDVTKQLVVIDLQNMQLANIFDNFPIQLQSFSMMATGGRSAFKYSRFIVSPDGNHLIVGNADHSVIYFNTTTGNIDFSIDGITNCSTVGLSGDGAKTVAVSYDWNSSELNVYQIDNNTHTITGTVLVNGYSLSTYEVAVNEDGQKAYIGVSNNSSALVRFETSDFTAYSQNYTPFWIGVSPDHQYAVHGQNRFSIFDFESESFSDHSWGNSQSYGAVSPVELKVAGYDPLRYEGVYFYDCTNPSNIILKGHALAGSPPEGDVPYRIAVSPDGTKAVSVNNMSHSISIINLQNYTLDTIINIEEDGWEVAISHDSKWAVIGGYDLNTIKIIDLTTYELVKTLTTGQRPMMLQISPDDQFVYVGNLKGNSVSIVALDGVDSHLITTIPTGVIGISFTAFGVKSGVELDPSGQFLLVAASFDDLVQVIDITQQQIVASINVGDFPLQIAFNATGEYAAITNRFDNTFSIIHVDGANSSLVGTFSSLGDAPLRLAYNPVADEFGIINYNSKNIIHVNPETGNINSSDSYAAYGSPAQIKYDAEGNPIVLIIASGNIPGYLIKNLNEVTELPATPTFFSYHAEDDKAAVCMPGPDHVSVIEYHLNTDPPIADFEANQTIIHINESVDFTDLSTNNPTSWQWAFEGGTPATSIIQNPNIVYETVGTFDVSLTAINDYGSDTKLIEDYITVETVDFIDTKNDMVQLSVYPNPTQGNISISLHEQPQEEINYAVFDMNGRMLIRGALQQKDNSIDLKNIDSGVYFLKVSTTKGNRILKISKR